MGILSSASLVKGIFDSLFSLFKYIGDRKATRYVIRQNIFAPRIYDKTIHKREIAEYVADDIFTTVYKAKDGASGLLSALTWWTLNQTQLKAKKRLVADMIQRQAEAMYEFTKVYHDKDDLHFRFDEGKDDMDDFIKRLLIVIGND